MLLAFISVMTIGIGFLFFIIHDNEKTQEDYFI